MLGGITANNNNELRNKLIELARIKYHKPYIHGSHGPECFDCAGFIWYLYNETLNINIYENGFGLSTTTKIMTSSYGKITLYKENSLNKNLKLIKPGDILFFHRQSLNDNFPKENNKYPGHCGIYLGNNAFMHCSRSQNKIIINTFNKDYWKKVLVASKDIISDYNKKY